MQLLSAAAAVVGQRADTWLRLLAVTALTEDLAAGREGRVCNCSLILFYVPIIECVKCWSVDLNVVETICDG
jgi:hypothetical protein